MITNGFIATYHLQNPVHQHVDVDCGGRPPVHDGSRDGQQVLRRRQVQVFEQAEVRAVWSLALAHSCRRETPEHLRLRHKSERHKNTQIPAGWTQHSPTDARKATRPRSPGAAMSECVCGTKNPEPTFFKWSCDHLSNNRGCSAHKSRQ